MQKRFRIVGKVTRVNTDADSTIVGFDLRGRSAMVYLSLRGSPAAPDYINRVVHLRAWLCVIGELCDGELLAGFIFPFGLRQRAHLYASCFVVGVAEGVKMWLPVIRVVNPALSQSLESGSLRVWVDVQRQRLRGVRRFLHGLVG